MVSETLLMVDLAESEEILIKRLIRSFEIRTESVQEINFKDYVDMLHKKEFCLIIIGVTDNLTRTIEKIRTIKKMLSVAVPLLVLVPSKFSPNINRYMKAGADDYIITPLNEESFAMRFYVLLECGQAMLQIREVNNTESKSGKSDNSLETQASKDNSDDITNTPEPCDEGSRDSSFQEESSTRQAPRKDRSSWHLIVGYLQEGLSFFAPKTQFARKGKRPIFNKWIPVRKLATGGDGVIWLVRELGKEQEAVAKIPHSAQMNINSLRAAAVLKRLVYHPNIVHLIEVVKDNDKFILIQEYVEGLTLPEFISSRANISSKEKESLFLQLVAVISYSHDHKIIHRDIKPDNIMIRSDGRLKLLDFGSAKEIAWMDRDSSPEGTLSFMPPEQLNGKPCLASDVWALGVILYLFSVNRLPFYHDNSSYPMNLEMDMVAVPPGKIRPDIPFNLEKVIMQCLEPDLEKRYKNASELRDDLLAKVPDFGEGMLIPEV